MEHITKMISILVICVIVKAHQTTAHDAKNTYLINAICSQAHDNKDVCIQVLNSEPGSPGATPQDLAIIALRVAAKNASAILTDVKKMIDDPELDPEIQQGLADCKETILDAESQLEDTIAALLVDSSVDAKTWLKAALAAITTCDASIPGNDDVLSVKSAHFRKLCNIAVVIIRTAPTYTLKALLH